MKTTIFFGYLLCAPLMMITPVYAENRASSPVIAKKTIILKDLNFKTVITTFYGNQLKHIVIPELDKTKTQYVGYQEKNDQIKALIYGEPVAYLNSSKQQRFLLTVSRVVIDEENKKINYCFACSSYSDVYIFQKNSNQQFELVSKATDEDAWVGMGMNDDTYNPNGILSNLVNVGPNIKGVVETVDVSRQGYSSKILYIAPMNELATFKMIEIAVLDSDNEATGDDKVWGYHGKYKFLNSVHNGLYDLEIKYTGTERLYSQTGSKIMPKKETHIYQYDDKKQSYIRVQ
ncbi:hypothetical protein G9F32_04385 [Acinetobacter sp. 194]|uniref:hypothetical protein n=1 Tax=Acinetobacter shaoyimingii TaxID=2715164 RepID=UPI00140B35CC|nr:hypothetical protein [Acinetobacter shaoyimingii]NHB57271.1 hypothetical protein [Acinetobacter shaoyimingii]